MRCAKQGRNQIRQILTPEQLPKFEEYLRKLDEERRKRAKRNSRHSSPRHSAG